MACAHGPMGETSLQAAHPAQAAFSSGEGLAALRVVGRRVLLPADTAQNLPARLRVAHSGTQISTCTTGEHLDVWLADVAPAADGSPKLSFAVDIDGEPRRPLVLEPLRGPWTRIASRLPRGEHCITLTRNQEAQGGELDIGGVATSPGATLRAPPPKAHQLWAIGDSITAGYGNRCAAANVPFGFWSEDIAATYVARAAHALDAEVTWVTSSGRGLWRNGDGTMLDTVPQLFARALPSTSETAYVPHDEPLPQAILINLGTNDLRKAFRPADRAAFVATYVAFLGRLRALAPDALLVVGLGPMLTDAVREPPKPLTLGRQLIRQVVSQATRARLGPIEAIEYAPQTGAEGFGCQYHPNLAVHRQMAAQLTEFLAGHLGWEAH